MAKKVAVLAVNPVNGFGLFEYLESFFENGIPFKTFAVADSTEIKTNAGVTIIVDDVVANLKGKEDEFDAVVFACGDAIPKLQENIDKAYNKDMMEVLSNFGKKGKLLIGHCGAGLIFDQLGLAGDKVIAVHPYVKSFIQGAKATDAGCEIDGNVYTAQTENTLNTLIPKVLDALK